MGVNTCAICLDHLSTSPFGAAVPCGHCFHKTCFDAWCQSEQSKRRSSSAQCPLCKEKSSKFCRLFLDMTAITNSSNEIEDTSFDESDREERERNAQNAIEVNKYMQKCRGLRIKLEHLKTAHMKQREENEFLHTKCDTLSGEVERLQGGCCVCWFEAVKGLLGDIQRRAERSHLDLVRVTRERQEYCC